jgi:hypothetical protein
MRGYVANNQKSALDAATRQFAAAQLILSKQNNMLNV